MLDEVRVLDLSEEPGWLAGKILAELGADVVKVEPPGGDPGRVGPFLGDVESPDRSLKWLALNTSKRGITLNLRRPRGAELLRELAQGADVLLETAAPGAMAERGCGFDSLRVENPGLVWCAITPFGQTGPWARHRAHDLVVVALGGNALMTGDPDRPPVRCSLPTAYLHAAPEAALGIAMALWARGEGGRGQLVDVSMQECQLATLLTGPGQHAMQPRPRRRTGARLGATREIWQAQDGWITFGLRGGQARIPNLVATVEYMAEHGMAPQWVLEYDWSSYNHNTLTPQEVERLEGAFGAFFATRTRRELYEQALARRIMLAPCNDAGEISQQPQLRFRELFQTLEVPELGASIEVPAFFAKSNRCPIGVRGPAPRVGQHNAEVYTEIGVTPDELRALAEEGVV
jgi:crotonobetainyl-CoA:carnitine CoA-transferase CaiB-like acyl-CoA transferase